MDIHRSFLSYRYSAPASKRFIPPVRAHALRRQDVPPADPHVLEMIEKDPVRLIKIDGVIREVSFFSSMVFHWAFCDFNEMAIPLKKNAMIDKVNGIIDYTSYFL